jgi:glycosyltransferase involved in cell wall biosynthesis
MTSVIDVIIPARDESLTLGPIIDAFHGSKRTGKVIVVDDKSVDGTWNVAVSHGALVITGPGEGKGQAVMTGLPFVSTLDVVLCDADLTGFTIDHAKTLMDDFPLNNRPLLSPERYEIIGVPDFSPNLPWAHKVLDSPVWGLVSGERRLPLALLKELDLHGYAMEVQINAAVQAAGLPVIRRGLKGVKGVTKPGSYERRVREFWRDLEWLRKNGA